MIVEYLKILIVAFIVVVIAKAVLHLNLKKIFGLIINTLLGLGVLWLINYTGFVTIPLNLITCLVVGVFGLPGVIVLILATYFGVL